MNKRDEACSADALEQIPDGMERRMLNAFHQYRSLLLSIAYRMLGSWVDAEDIVQEAFIRWRQATDDDIRSPRAFLVTVVSRLCINHLQSARVQREEYFGEWLPEPLIGRKNEEALEAALTNDSLSMAFLVLLQQLNPMERAVFILREVFDYEYDEIAGILGHNEANCRQILKRARQHIAEVRPRFEASLQEREKLLQAFLEAADSGDLGGLVAMLSATAVLHSDGGGKAPALPNPIYGPDKIARALLGGTHKFAPKNLVRRLAQVNGQPGAVSYLNGRAFAVFTVDVQDGRIQSIYLVTNPEKLARLGPLPEAPC